MGTTMSVYDAHLPLAFPHCFEVPVETAITCSALLVRSSSLCINGSSYAITADANKFGYRHLWLSAVSLKLVKNIILAGSSPEPEVSEPVEDDQSRVINRKESMSNEDLAAMIKFREQLDDITGDDFA